jgi:hypothetical protein
VYPVVTEAKVIRPYVIEATFSDGTRRRVDVEAFLWGPVLEKVRNPDYFAQMYVDLETVARPNGADFAPETLSAAGQQIEAAEEPAAYSESRRLLLVKPRGLAAYLKQKSEAMRTADNGGEGRGRVEAVSGADYLTGVHRLRIRDRRCFSDSGPAFFGSLSGPDSGFVACNAVALRA